MAAKPATRRERLEQLRDQLTAAARVAEPRELPAIARELRGTLAELEALPEAKAEVSVRDRLTEQRRKRAGLA